MLKINSITSFAKRHFTTLVPFLNIYKLLNIMLSIYEMKTKKTNCISRPFIFRIDPCSICNLRCISCTSHTKITQEKKLMDFKDYKLIINSIKKYALRTSLYDMGEPLLNKDIYKMIGYSSINNISTLISTNFNHYNIEEIFNSKLTVLEPCLDGFTQKNYEKYRKKGRVDIVKQGIQSVMEYKHKTKSKWPIVDVQIVLFDHIMHEIKDIETFLKQCKVDRITFREEILGFNSPQTSAANKKGKIKSCFWLYLGMMIRPDGSVYPCCGRGFNRFSYGNIIKQDIKKIWNNKYYKFSRSLFIKGPNLVYDEEMKNIPCLSCNRFKKERTMLKPM